MNQQKIFTSFKWDYNCFGQGDKHLAHCTRSEILPTMFCVVELFAAGLTVTCFTFVEELNFISFSLIFLDHAFPLKQPFHLQSTARSITPCFHSVCFPTSKVHGKGFDFLCVICWSSSGCVNCTLAPRDGLVCSGLSEIAVLPASFQLSFSVCCTLPYSGPWTHLSFQLSTFYCIYSLVWDPSCLQGIYLYDPKSKRGVEE